MPAESGPVSRRRVLQSGALLVGGGIAFSGPGAADEAATETTTVMSRNIYLGARLRSVFDVRSYEEFERTVDELYRSATESRFEDRARGIAAEIAEHEPALVGLQEVARFVADGERDYLQTLSAELDDRGLSYRPAATVETFDSGFPALGESGAYPVRFVNRDVLLARDDVPTSDPRAGHYVPGSGELSLGRGYCSVVVDGSFRVVNTHLATAATPLLQAAQAVELLRRFDDTPTVLLGDLNSGPGEDGTLTYDLLTGRGGYADAYAAANPNETGYTCCRSLASGEPSLERRIDHVLTRGGFEVRRAERVGHESDAKVEELWPSDHAGVVATLAGP